MNLAPYLEFLPELATASGNVIRPYFGNHDQGLVHKADESPVTLADRQAEETLRALIEKKFPSHGIIGEEYGNKNPEAEFVWVLDPIDGTKSFITACPLFGTLIGLLHEGEPVLGCIHQPILNQLMIGDGTITTLNGMPVRVRETTQLKDATLLTSDWLFIHEHQNGPAFESLAKKVRFSRTWGDCYGYLLLASGWADIMVDALMNPWDLLPLVPVVRGAGGLISDWQGVETNWLQRTSAVATTPALSEAVLAVLNV